MTRCIALGLLAEIGGFGRFGSATLVQRPGFSW